MPRSGSRLAVLLFATVFGAGTPTSAQIPDAPPPDSRSFLVGPVRVWPLFIGEVEVHDNLFQVPDAGAGDRRSATVVTAAPGFLAELPFSNSRARLGYAASYRDFGVSGIATNWSHHAVADVRLVFGNGVIVEAEDEFRRGVLDTRVFDPGGDVTFRGEEFRRNVAALGIGHARREDRSLFLRGARSTHATVGERLSGLFDFDETRLSAEGEHRLSPRTWVTWDVASTSIELTRPIDSGVDSRTVRGVHVRAGGRGRVGAHGNWSLVWGRADYRFEGNGRSRFRGLVMDGSYRHQIAGRPSLTVRLARSAYPLLGGGGDYYVSHQLSAQLEIPTERRLVAGAWLAYYENDYPQLVPRREDRVLYGELWGGYRFRGWVEWRAFVRTTRRSSPEPLAEFDDTRIGTVVRIGG